MTTPSQVVQLSIDTERVAVTSVLSKWKSDVDNISSGSSDPASLISRAQSSLGVIKGFMSDLSAIVNNLNPGNSGLNQAAINAFQANMNSGQSALNQAIATVTAADTGLSNAQAAYDQAKNKLALEIAGSSAESIAAQAAKVAQARSELAKDVLASPIDGTITRVDPNVGEFAIAGQSSFAVQSSGSFKIEAFVPEADIAKVALGNMASTTLDAYGQYVDFPAKVTAIDPAETVLEGVSTYKVTLQFVVNDPRILSGMTANTDILTHENNNVLTIPSRAIVDTNGAKSARVMNTDGKTYKSVQVTVGLKGSDGMTEILSGLKDGDKVVTYIK